MEGVLIEMKIRKDNLRQGANRDDRLIIFRDKSVKMARETENLKKNSAWFCASPLRHLR